MATMRVMTMIKLYLSRSNHLSDNGYSMEEQEKIYDDQLVDLYLHARWYLDNLDFLPTYRVSWHNYRTKSAPVPYKMVNKTVKR